MPKVTDAHVEARRRQIMQATIVCVAEKGFQRTTMHDICRTAELSPGAVYGYFSGKEEILEALVQDTLEQNDALLEEVSTAGSSREILGALMHKLLSCAEGHCEQTLPAPDPNRIKVGLWGEIVRDAELRRRAKSNHDRVLDGIAKLMRAGQRRGEVRKDVDARLAAAGCIALVEGFALQKAIDPELSSARYETVADALLDGLLEPA